MRISAIEERIAADLDLGRHHELIPELETLIGQHPYRERCWEQLMTALYRSGRQGDALAAFQRAGEVLREELGIDPSPDLQHLQEQILRQDPALDLSGEALRGYRLLELLGEGAFGAVHRAFQPAVGREVAVKVIHPGQANDPEFIRRFDVEAQLVARLEHPYIVPVYDYWRDPDGAYLVMRYLRGGSLRQVLARGPLEPDRALKVIDQVADALAAAHRQGVVHRDVQPANVLFDEEGNTYLSDFGIARDLAIARAATERTAPAEFAYYLSPEEARGETPTQRADIYSLGLVLYECLTGRRAVGDPRLDGSFAGGGGAAIPSVSSIRPGLPPGLDAVVARATAEDPAARYPDVLAFSAATQEAIGRGARGSRDVGESPPRTPYKGLHAFLEADADDFFGRESLVDRLVARLGEEVDGRRFLALVGPSGSGKSSTVRAGLIPRLRRGALPGSDTWFFIEMMPGAHPLDEVEAALLRVATNPPPDLIALLRRDEQGLVEAAGRVLPPDGSELFLVVDQFEEVFTFVEDEEERARFLAALVAAVEDPCSRVRAVVTLRADFYDRPLLYRAFGDLLASRVETVTPLTVEELERAIAGPAQRVGLRVEPALLAQLVTEASDRSGALPLLQYALTEVFERRRDGTLTIADYREAGGITGALAGRAESLLSTGSEATREATRQMFLRLVHVDVEMEDLRRRVRRSELETVEGNREAMAGAIESFTHHRLLTSDRDQVTREPTVEVAHEALLRSWPRLRGWLDSAREDMRNHRQVAEEAAAWAGSGRDASFLLRGSRLDRLQAWAGASSVALNAIEREYLDASMREREAEHQAAQAQRERERLLERRSNKRLRALVAVLTAAALVAVGLTIVANRQRQQAAHEARIATARELSAAAVANLDVDPERSILLALEAVNHTRSVDGFVLPEAEEALHRAVIASRFVRFVPGGDEALDWSPTGAFVAVRPDNDGMVDIRNPETGKTVLAFQGPRARITDVSFSPDGSSLATTSADGTLTVWDVSNGDPLAGMAGRGAASGPSFSGDGSLVIGAWSKEGTVRVLDLSTNLVTRTLRDLPGASHTAFDPDGRKIAVATENFLCNGARWKVLVIDLETGDRTVLPGSEPCGASFVSWSPDGRYVSANDRVWDAGTGALRFTLFGHTDEVMDADWSPDSSRLVTGAFDGTAKVWEITAGGARQLLSLSAEDTRVVSEVAFSPDGTRVMTNGPGQAARIWDVGPGGDAEVANLPTQAPAWWLGDVAFLSRGRRVVVPNGTARLAVWDVATGRKVGTVGPRISPPEGWTTEPSFDASLDGASIAIAPGDQTVGLWDTATRREIFSIEAPTEIGTDVNPLDLSPDGGYLAIGTPSGGVRIVDRSGRDVGSLDAGNRTTGVRFGPDGRLIAVSTADQVTIWDWRNHTLNATIPAPFVEGRMDFDPTGRVIATAGDDRWSRIWDVGTGDLRATLPRQPGDIYWLTFSPNGSRVATGTAEGVVRVFDARSGEQLLELPGQRGAVAGLAFSPDGRMLVAATHDGPARIWSLDIDDLERIARREVTRTLTVDECRQYLHIDGCPRQ